MGIGNGRVFMKGSHGVRECICLPFVYSAHASMHAVTYEAPFAQVEVRHCTFLYSLSVTTVPLLRHD